MRSRQASSRSRLNLGAYSTEIVRAGLEAIPRNQIEAGHSLGLSGWQVFRHIVMMPALQIIYPALTSQFVLLMLATSVVSQISAPDLFHVASIIQSRTFRDFEIYAVVAVIYLGLALMFRMALLGHRARGFRTPMIREFTFIDLYYLVLAARWTLALTALAFLGGGIVGIFVALLRVSPWSAAARHRRRLRRNRPGHAAARLAVRILLRPADRRHYQVSPWIAATVAYSIYAGAFLGEIWRGCLRRDPAPAMGGRQRRSASASSSSCAT